MCNCFCSHCLSFFAKMLTRIDRNFLQIFTSILFYTSLTLDESTALELEMQDTPITETKFCIPCKISKYQTYKSLEQDFVMDSDLRDVKLECWHGGLKSIMMHYDNNELDLDISIINPYQNKNEGCSFQVYWKDMLQTTIQINQDGQAQSSNSTWHLYPDTKTKNGADLKYHFEKMILLFIMTIFLRTLYRY